MGDYSIVCAITGLPITGRQKVVGIGLEPYKYRKERMARHLWVPSSFPIFGEYDYGGGIETEQKEILPKFCAIMHRDVWDNAEMYWHHLNNQSPLCLAERDVKEILDRALKEKEMCKLLARGEVRENKEKWTTEDYVYHALDFYQQYMATTDYWLVLRYLFDSKNVSRAGRKKGNCFLQRNKFAQIICKKIANNDWKQQDLETLTKIISLFGGEKIIGKYIAPSEPNGSPYIEQYPEYQQRIKTLDFSIKLAKKLQKDRNK